MNARSPGIPARLTAVLGAVLLLLGCLTAVADRVSAAPSLLSQGKPATASSTENTDYTPARAAFDGDTGTRWASAFADPQWIQVDLGATASVERITLNWEGAYARAFQLQVSADGAQWTTVYSTAAGTGGAQSFNVSGTGRHVRMYGTARATGYGYSLWEFQVFGTTGGQPPGPGPVKVVGSQGNWQLTVGGQPYTIKGLTWGPSVADAGRYMPDLKSMGVNTIRTWGTDASSRPLFDTAQANGIRVIAGFWLQPGGGPGSGGCVNYVTDTAYKTTMLGEIRNWVTTYKDHQGVLMWNVGNESVLGLQNCYSGAELENQRNAYTTFVNEAAKAIHAIDVNHPVTSTDAWVGAWPYYKANSPDLDLYAVNAYNAVCGVRQAWIDGGYTKPYIVTEAGPAGEWEVPDDANGVPNEPTDVQKRDGYTSAWNCITGHTGVSLGATMFHYGLEEDFGGVWFNLLPSGQKRLSYYAVKQLYSGQGSANTPPVITNLNVAGAGAVAGGSQFRMTANVSDPNGDAVTYAVKLNSKYINDAGGFIDAPFVRNADGSFSVTAPQMLGVWKVYLYARDGQGNIGIETRSIRVVPPPVSGTNLARGRPATASSYQTWGDYNPGKAVDGDLTTRWASDWADPQWIQVDLGAPTAFRHVQLVWETSFARSYQIQVSNDGVGWTTVHSTTAGDGGADDVDINATARYVRVTGTQRGTEWGYSLFEFGVYGN
ncbi:discoidin domain-containing protein [Phytomonospora sp. NPDC050363]|uniref:discoidin domain-containing protein n=1 Tax=Phytomonospora sp. NPDC050363 TaxID=3155642 RepID=UPI00340D0024